ncbi:hypothetical protein [Streptomyces sp. NPDC056242]|uniref:hypothetical protein n=1 Tax=Streptomyces sp. NPDC056242 TaxID=3345760 RepID=UPI0035D9576A
MTAPGATNKRTPKIRENLPAPTSPEGELFHYTPYEAAQWAPFSGRTIADMCARREIEYVNNGRDNYLTGLQIAAISRRFTISPFSKPARAKAVA